jgi:hypothetical protein
MRNLAVVVGRLLLTASVQLSTQAKTAVKKYYRR